MTANHAAIWPRGVAGEAARADRAVIDRHLVLLAGAQVRREPGAAADLQADDLAVRHVAQLATSRRRRTMEPIRRDQTDGGAQRGERLTQAAGEQARPPSPAAR